jgi:hypothetical protein
VLRDCEDGNSSVQCLRACYRRANFRSEFDDVSDVTDGLRRCIRDVKRPNHACLDTNNYSAASMTYDSHQLAHLWEAAQHDSLKRRHGQK